MSSSSHSLEQPDFTKLYVFGAGGAGREVAWFAAQKWGERVAVEFVVDGREYLRESVNGLPVRLIGGIEPDLSSRYIVALGDSAMRRRFASMFDLIPMREAQLIHPKVELSSWVEVGSGSIICAGVTITTNVKIGRHVYININCSISHDVFIGNYVTLSPGVHISGHVHIEDDVFIGTGANIINGCQDAPLVIGAGAIIGAGACVIGSVERGAMMTGVPAARRR